MYQSVYYNRETNKITLIDDVKGVISFPYKKYAYKKNSNGKFSTITGVRVDKVTKWDEADEHRGQIYESDIRPEVRTLIDMYGDTDDMSVNHREVYLDIEVDRGDSGYSTADEAKNVVNAITYYDKFNKKYLTFLLDIHDTIQPISREDYVLRTFSSEHDLLSKFLHTWSELSPTIITGWNIDYFDIPYLYNRIEKVLGAEYANLLSPLGKVTWNNRLEKYFLAGCSCLDYMALYKLFSQNERSNYSLDFISKHELGKGKLEYDGTLDTLFRTDIEKFLEYNIHDVRLVLELDEKLKFLELARGVCHKGHVPYEDIFFTTRYLDGACLTYIKRLGIVAPNRPSSEEDERMLEDTTEDSDEAGFDGAYVKTPIPGRYKWVYDIDMSSLYPSVIRTLNISPETKVLRVDNWNEFKDLFVNNITDKIVSTSIVDKELGRVSSSTFRQWLTNHNYSVSSIGVVYDCNSEGLVPAILRTWMVEREDCRALAKKYGKEGNQTLATFYDGRQLTMKIINNSLYGALGNPGFRFYDLDNAESVTLTGQDILKNNVETVVNKWYLEKTNINKDHVIYVDTDSSFLSAQPFIDIVSKKMGRNLSYDECATLTFKIASEVESYVNSSFNSYAERYHNVKKHYLAIKQEYVSESAFWVMKKRYAQKIVMEKGVLISDLTKGKSSWKLDVKGMDVVRSSFPALFRTFLAEILTDILNFETKESIDTKIVNFKQKIKESNYLDIMSPTGVKDIKKYKTKRESGMMFSPRLKGTPAHVKAALNYNDMISYNKIKDTPPIVNGDKIKWVYLKENSYALETLAVKGYDDPKVVVDFILQNIDYDEIFERTLKKKLQKYYTSLGYGLIPENTNANEFFSFN